MNISIEEFKQLLSLLEKPIIIKMDKTNASITISTKCKKDTDDTMRPLKIDNQVISKLGIYDIKGVRFWIVKDSKEILEST